MKNIKQNLKWYLLAVLFLVNLLIGHAIFSESRNGILTVAFLDVGQGDAIFIEAPNGNQMLIDGGPSKAVLKALSLVMPFYDRSIDVVLATHPDKDHIGGLPAVFENFDVEYFIEPGVSADTAVYHQLLQITATADAAGALKRIFARRGMRVSLDEEVEFIILFPDRDVSGISPNDASVVAKLIYNDTSFLLTGDAPVKIERFIASLDGAELDVDVLKVGHHGSKTSTSRELLGFASPYYAVISAGRDNRYRHPHEEVLSLLEQFGVNVLRTDESGTIIFKSNGENIFIE